MNRFLMLFRQTAEKKIGKCCILVIDERDELPKEIAMTVSEILAVDLKNREWIETRFREIGEQYGGKYIAVHNQKVIAAGDTIGEVRRAMRQAALFPFISEDEVTITYLTDEPHGMLL
ncbi:hypothetical protein KAX17_09875 [Candidatus Bipolaricaulota bacterium]|nr:hypothetical protein [Candidatus Bipolaricaulota bacterium]